MPARTGQQYIDGLRAQEREVWLGGERVRDVTKHKGLAGGVQAIARLYDMQHDAKLREMMTYPSPTTGEPVGRSFDNPKTKDALETRTRMMLNWARATCGMMGRSPDFMNVTFAAWGAAADFFGEKRPEFADNMRPSLRFLPPYARACTLRACARGHEHLRGIEGAGMPPAKTWRAALPRTAHTGSEDCNLSAKTRFPSPPAWRDFAV